MPRDSAWTQLSVDEVQVVDDLLLSKLESGANTRGPRI